MMRGMVVLVVVAVLLAILMVMAAWSMPPLPRESVVYSTMQSLKIWFGTGKPQTVLTVPGGTEIHKPFFLGNGLVLQMINNAGTLGATSGIYFLQSRSLQLTRVSPNDGAWYSDPAPTADGRGILYSRRDAGGGYLRIWMKSCLYGGETILLTPSEEMLDYVQPAAAGPGRVLFTKSDSSSDLYEVWLLEGGNETSLVADNDIAQNSWPAARGDEFVYARDEFFQGKQVYRRAIAGNGKGDLLVDDEMDQPCCSLDGNFVYGVHTKLGKSVIVRVIDGVMTPVTPDETNASEPSVGLSSPVFWNRTLTLGAGRRGLTLKSLTLQRQNLE